MALCRAKSIARCEGSQFSHPAEPAPTRARPAVCTRAVRLLFRRVQRAGLGYRKLLHLALLLLVQLQSTVTRTLEQAESFLWVSIYYSVFLQLTVVSLV